MNKKMKQTTKPKDTETKDNDIKIHKEKPLRPVLQKSVKKVFYFIFL